MQHRRHPRSQILDRRSFLSRGAWTAGLGLVPPTTLYRAMATLAGDPKAKGVIHVFLQGGLSHLDSFDPKPYAPIEVRGEFRAIPTKIPGEAFSEVLARTARIADRLAVIRSVTHTEAAHERGTHSMLTGYQPSPAIRYPSLGAVTAHELPGRNQLPAYVCIPNAGDEYLGTGYLGSAHGPFSIGGEPSAPNFRVRDLERPRGLDEDRMQRRKRLVQAIDAGCDASADAIEAQSTFYEQAYALIGSDSARAAFDLGKETDQVKDLYGRTQLGQRLLLARRLVEGGARFVTVLHGGYDNHRDIFPALRGRLSEVDQALSGLITDLEVRGLLGSTLVLMSSEFGRTPRVNQDRGRDHWPRVFSVVMAGGGIRGGAVLGSSTADGGEPEDEPVRPADLAATLFHQIGIDPTAKLMSPGNRPIDIVRDGRVLRELLG